MNDSLAVEVLTQFESTSFDFHFPAMGGTVGLGTATAQAAQRNFFYVGNIILTEFTQRRNGRTATEWWKPGIRPPHAITGSKMRGCGLVHTEY